MRSFTATLAGEPVTIHAPEPGTAVTPADVAEACTSSAPWGLDVEGTALTDLAQWDPDFGLRLVQLASADDVAWVLTLTDPVQLGTTVELLADPDLSFTSHTPMDVLSVAVVLGVDITMRNVDTRSIANMVYTSKTHDRSLKALATRHGMPELAAAEAVLKARFLELYRAAHPERGRRAVADKDLQAFGWSAISPDDPAYLIYAGLDALVVRRLLPILIAAGGNPASLVRREVWLAGRANRRQLGGMRVDVDRLDAVEAEARAETGAASAAVAELTGGIKIKSPKLKDWLGGHGVDWSAWAEHGGDLTKGGAPSLAGDSALVLRTFELDDEGSQVVEAVLRAQAWADRLLKAEGVRSHLTADRRIHPGLQPNGATATSRMSSAGPNMQNFSAATRRLFIPDPGHVLVSVDFDQVELRVVAALAREEKMIKAICEGIDLHQFTADLIGRPRKVAKPTNFLIVYGGGAKALAGTAGLPRDECATIISDWYAAYPSISAYARYMGTERDAVYSASGRRLPIGWKKEDDGRMTPRHWANINYVVQSSARDLITGSWVRLDEAGYGDMLWFPVHDELILQVPEDRVSEVIAATEAAMRFDFRGVPISATGIVLRDRDGESRWLDGHEAEEIATEMGWAA